jgi:hypothetical protein
MDAARVPARSGGEASRRAGRLHRRGIVGLGLVTGGLMLWAGRLILIDATGLLRDHPVTSGLATWVATAAALLLLGAATAGVVVWTLLPRPGRLPVALRQEAAEHVVLGLGGLGIGVIALFIMGDAVLQARLAVGGAETTGRVLEVHSGGRWPAGTAIVEYRAGDRLVRAAIRDVAFDSGSSFDALTRPGASPRVRYDRGSPGNAVLAAQHELVQPALWTLGVLAWIALVTAIVGLQLRRARRLRRLAASPGPGRRMRVVGADDDPEDSSLVLAPLGRDGDPPPLGVPLVTGQHLAALRPGLQVEVLGEPRDNGLVVVRLDSGLVLWPRGRCTAKA